MESPERPRETIDDLDALLRSLPPEIVDAVNALPDRNALIEVVMDLGRRPKLARSDGSPRPGVEADLAFVVDIGCSATTTGRHHGPSTGTRSATGPARSSG